jgi:alpha/beta superfamily hydrolase
MSPTATPAVATRSVTFTTSDHLTLTGFLFGSGGHTALVFSNQTDTSASDWAPMARAFAARGYLALTYNYRGTYGSQGTFDTSPLDKDLSAAMAFAIKQGATRIVLVGASIGGAVTARSASQPAVACMVILSAPREWPVLPVTDDALRAISAPKLFLDSQNDEFADDIQAMYDASSPPKEIHLYVGAAHGLDMFGAPYADDLTQRIMSFVQTSAAPA